MTNLKKTILAFTAFSLIFMLAGSQAFAQEEPEIQVTQVTGKALVREVGNYMWQPPSTGDKLFAGDRIRLRGGQVALVFPQAQIQILDKGEMELPVELIDGYAEPWKNDLDMYIGTYQIQTNDNLPLTLHTPYGEVEAKGAALFTLTITTKGSSLQVHQGQVALRHRTVTNQGLKVVSAGNSARIFGKGIQLKKGGSDVVALR